MPRPKALKGRNIRRRTGARAQSKQIAALSTQVAKLSKQTVCRFALAWQKKNESVEPVSSSIGNQAYILPVPTGPCDPFVSSTTNPQGANTWTDNRYGQNQTTYRKVPIFGIPTQVKSAKHIQHMGSKLMWQLTSTENDFSKLTIALIKPKRKYADQLTIDRLLVTGNVPGELATISTNLDFMAFDGGAGSTGQESVTMHSVVFDRTKWDVIHKREVAFSHPGATQISGNVNPANTRPKNNAIIKTGTFYVPKAKNVVRNVSKRVDGSQNPVNAIGTGVLDESNEDRCYLVVIGNGNRVDAATISLSCITYDYYASYS